jgi:uracil-DNA glycosylase
MSKQDQLNKLKKEILNDKILPFVDTASNLVFGQGDSDADFLFLGEAPGKNEDLTGIPFNGAAGKILNQSLEVAGLSREEVFITSVLMYRPPKNRDPKPEEIKLFEPYIDQLIQIIKPKVIVTLGRFSLNKFLPKAKISEVHGQPHKISWQGLKLTIVPMYHPASVLYRRNLEEILKEDFKLLKTLR